MDLKKSLPRIALADSIKDFMEIVSAGRALASLHLNYDNFSDALLINEGDSLLQESTAGHNGSSSKRSAIAAKCNTSLRGALAPKQSSGACDFEGTLSLNGAESKKYNIKVIDDGKGDYNVSKMKWAKKWKELENEAVARGEDLVNLTNTIIYNSHVKITGVPRIVQEYIVNGRSAVDWVIERYRVKTDKDSNITNDPNKWAREHGDARYILNLILSVIDLSIKSVGVINKMPRVEC